MSRPAQLPPRFPNPSRGHTHPHQQQSQHHQHPVRYLGAGDDQPLPPLHRFASQDSFFDEQALWLDGLLDDTSTTTTRPHNVPPPPPLRRAVSDPVGMLHESLAFDFSSFCSSPYDDRAHGGGGEDGSRDDTTTTGCKDAAAAGDGDDLIDKITACSGLDSGSLYGPNSPRKMKNLTESESSVVSAAFEGVNWGNPFQYVSVNPTAPSGPAAAAASASASDAFTNAANNTDGKPDASVTNAANVADQDRAAKRHTGQRSRVRKLQYIAELERTVNLYQAMEADLAAKVASLFHQRAILSLENSNLKQQLAGLKKEKMMKDAEQQYLKKELKKLKSAYGHQAHHRKSMSSSCYPMGGMGPMAAADSSEANWAALDMAMGNLSLKETLPMKYGFRS